VLHDIHQSFAWFFIVSNGLAGLWCLGAHWWPQLRTRAMWWFVIGAELTVFIQVILGVMLVAGVGGTKYEPPKFHMLYGFSGIFAVGILFSYKGSMRKQQYLLYGLGGLFIMGLGIRAMLVGTAAVS
jgi:NAD/NADP transhydrogenase beta subunit